MVVTAGIILLALIVALFRGGRLPEHVPFRHAWLVPLTLGLQIAGYFFPTTLAARFLTVASYGVLGYGLVVNARYQSVRIVLLGVLLNAVVIAANGGRIPVDVNAAEYAGVDVSSLVEGVDPKHVALADNAVLPFLGDVIPIPFPIHKVMSIGDLAVLVGIFFMVQDLMGKPIVLKS